MRKLHSAAKAFNRSQDPGAVQTPGLPVAQIETMNVNLSPSLLASSQLLVRLRAAQ